jgi:tRNA modification GTPase
VSSDRPYCACATPPGASGLAVIRMSGLGSAEVLNRVFCISLSADQAGSVMDMRGYTSAFGTIQDPKDGHTIDEVICTRFTAPHSYTGEDSVEISCHGGSAVRQEILRVLLENGARAAEPGEFTRTAFLSGKMDLSQAEAVMDVISADSTLALDAAERQLAGALKQKVRRISESLYQSYAALEMMVEYPEHEDSPENTEAILRKLSEPYRSLVDLENTFSQGKILREGMTVVLCGVPNSGKSSLLNRLAGYDRAIVAARPGTTRDTLEVFGTVEGIPVRLIDTAGLRDTEDEVEKLGVSRAYAAVKEADLLIWLCSPDGGDMIDGSELHLALTDLFAGKDVGILMSKSDLMDKVAADAYSDNMREQVDAWGFSDRVRFFGVFSSETGEGIDRIGNEVKRIYEEKGQGQQSQVLLTNSRHYGKVKDAAETLAETIAILQRGLSADLACSLLRNTMDALGEITGDCVNEELVQMIFSRFCIGK